MFSHIFYWFQIQSKQFMNIKTNSYTKNIIEEFSMENPNENAIHV